MCIYDPNVLFIHQWKILSLWSYESMTSQSWVCCLNHYTTSTCLHLIHRCTQGGGGWGGIKVSPPSKCFAKLLNKNVIKHRKGAPSPLNFHNPYTPSLPNFGKNLLDPSSGFSNRVHLWSHYIIESSHKKLLCSEASNWTETINFLKEIFQVKTTLEL